MRDRSGTKKTTSEAPSIISDTLPHVGPGKAGPPRILCVDDDPHMLEALQRALGFEFDVVTEADPRAALRRLEQDSDIEVILSDLKMPGIDGTMFLSETKRICPAATRLLLTGVPDLDAAIAAINQGGVFRFLTKPCPTAQLLSAMADAVSQHRRVIGEVEPEWSKAASSVASVQRAEPQAASARMEPRALPFAGLGPGSVRQQRVFAGMVPAASQTRRACSRPMSHLAVLAELAEGSLDEERAHDAERMLAEPLRALLKSAQSGSPTDPADIELAANLAARLAYVTRDGAWIDYAFLLFSALRQLLPSQAVDQIHVALYRTRGANPAVLHLYLSILEFNGRALSPPERCLLKRIQQCRGLMAMRA